METIVETTPEVVPAEPAAEVNPEVAPVVEQVEAVAPSVSKPVVEVKPVAEPTATYAKPNGICSKCGGDAFDTGNTRGGELVITQQGSVRHEALAPMGPSCEFEIKCADEICGWIGFRHF